MAKVFLKKRKKRKNYNQSDQLRYVVKYTVRKMAKICLNIIAIV